MILVMVHGQSGVNATYPVVWVQESGNAYVAKRRIVQKKEYTRQKLVLLISVQ